MTAKLRAAAEAALEALEWVYGGAPVRRDGVAAIRALRAALAEPDAEPVAWLYEDRISDGTDCKWGCYGVYFSKAQAEAILLRREHYHSGKVEGRIVPLYAAPPRRDWVGLTEQEIWDSVKHGVVGGIGMPSKAVAVARAIEAALKEKNA